MQLPLPLLTTRLSPRSSKSKTRPRHPRTFSDVLLWDSFSQGANQLLLSLDDQAAVYLEPRRGIWPGSAPVQAAADESESRSLITELADSLNQLAADIHITARLSGGGSNRSSSFTDLVVRPAEQVTDPLHLSNLIWAVGEVKGDWQLSVKRGLELPSVVHNRDELDNFLPGLQQVTQWCCSGHSGFQRCGKSWPLYLRKGLHALNVKAGHLALDTAQWPFRCMGTESWTRPRCSSSQTTM